MTDEMRDPGPYRDAAQVDRQWANWSQGLPAADLLGPAMLIQEALLLARVEASGYEISVLNARGLDPRFAQIIASWILRAGAPPRN